jgi:outer membrane protein OmpA-like peptidoglycan-associated protein
MNKHCYFKAVLFAFSSLPLALSFWLTAVADTPLRLRVTVNSNQDGAITSDDALTLREAIEITNGTLKLEQLSEAEKAQVSPIDSANTTEGSGSQIEFDLPEDQTIIRLTSVLPALASPGLVVDGTTQAGYDADTSPTAEIAIPAPVVEITPAEGVEVFRGLTIVADNVTIRGLSLYGFISRFNLTASTPPGDIFIAHRLPPPDISKQQPPANSTPFYSDDTPPTGIVVENNWLGIRPDESVPNVESAFGVSVFNGRDTTIRRNRIANHNGSAIITSVRAENLNITENIIVGNGIAGMPDAIRLEGNVNQTTITSNLICANDGSAIYLFKPQGAVQIRDNLLPYNGRRLRRAAVYLMGNDHQVTNNQILSQTGPGVVVAAFPESDRNRIENNRFLNLEGLSIDLVTQNNAGVQDYQRGDGPNPPRNSPNRRKDTGNAAINAPRFLSPQFVAVPDTDNKFFPVQIAGVADRGSQVQIYQTAGNTSAYGPLSQPLVTVPTDEEGQFSAILQNLTPGTQISAIATNPEYGTSEPARNALIVAPDGTPREPLTPPQRGSIPRCTTPPQPEPVPEPETPPPETPVQLKVPTRIHFALDKDNISPASAKILDQIAQVLKERPALLIEIRGHTDPRATDAYNIDLGNRRARSARNYLIRKGVAPERMTIRSFGERNLLTPGTSRLDYARNRRVEFIFSDATGLELVIQEADLQLEPAGGR